MLHKKLIDIQKEKEIELQQRNNMIAHFKDQLQEMKAKTDMEGKYLKKSAEVTVAQTQKKCTLSEKAMQDEIEVSMMVKQPKWLSSSKSFLNEGTRYFFFQFLK